MWSCWQWNSHTVCTTSVQNAEHVGGRGLMHSSTLAVDPYIRAAVTLPDPESLMFRLDVGSGAVNLPAGADFAEQ
jgi:hypothetical protein